MFEKLFLKIRNTYRKISIKIKNQWRKGYKLRKTSNTLKEASMMPSSNLPLNILKILLFNMEINKSVIKASSKELTSVPKL